MLKKISVSAGLLAGSLLCSGSAYALYEVSITNNYAGAVTWTSPLGKGKTTNPAQYRGDFSILVQGKGVVVAKDAGHGAGGGYAGCGDWGTVIAYRGERYGFYYGGYGMLHITINPDGSLTLSGGRIYPRDHKCGQWP